MPEPRCNKVLAVGDYWYGTQQGFWCDLEKGHSGPCQQTYNRYESQTGRDKYKLVRFTVTWEELS